MKNIGIGFLALIAILGIVWIAQGNDFFMYKVFAPKYEAARRTTFEQSRAFNQGMAQGLEDMQRDYVTTKDPAAKQTLKTMILHRASGYDMDDPIVPASLRDFVQSLKDEKTY